VSPNFTVIIPARLDSTRLPGKALADLGGKPMVVRVVEQAQRSAANKIYIATDNESIMAAAAAEAITAILTQTTHASGTERLSEAVDHIGLEDDALIVNVQGDEPFIDPALITALASHLHAHPHLPVVTACHLIKEAAKAFDPNVVKVVLDKNQHALYFSRAPIPYVRGMFDHPPIPHLPATLPIYQHIGIYAYRAGFLRKYRSLSASSLEQFENLEQLRMLWHGFTIGVVLSPTAPAPGIDTPDDLHQARQHWQQSNPV
jgi:3-deoxy-manno-octulosonate cytidylyltransferase (CMP-KDO synthetase)